MAAGIRDEAMRLIANLPDGSTWDDLLRLIQERLLLEQAIREADAGDLISHEQVEREFGLRD